MNSSNGAVRYFTVNIGCEAGINHLKSALRLLIKESVSLNRTPVVFAPRFLAAHNFDREISASWDRYVDLCRIGVITNGTAQYIEALPQTVIAHRDDFAVLDVKGTHVVTDAENAEYTLIVKNNPSGLGLDAAYGHDDFDFDVELVPS